MAWSRHGAPIQLIERSRANQAAAIVEMQHRLAQRHVSRNQVHAFAADHDRAPSSDGNNPRCHPGISQASWPDSCGITRVELTAGSESVQRFRAGGACREPLRRQQRGIGKRRARSKCGDERDESLHVAAHPKGAAAEPQTKRRARRAQPRRPAHRYPTQNPQSPRAGFS